MDEQPLDEQGEVTDAMYAYLLKHKREIVGLHVALPWHPVSDFTVRLRAECDAKFLRSLRIVPIDQP